MPWSAWDYLEFAGCVVGGVLAVWAALNALAFAGWAAAGASRRLKGRVNRCD